MSMPMYTQKMMKRLHACPRRSASEGFMISYESLRLAFTDEPCVVYHANYSLLREGRQISMCSELLRTIMDRAFGVSMVGLRTQVFLAASWLCKYNV